MWSAQSMRGSFISVLTRCQISTLQNFITMPDFIYIGLTRDPMSKLFASLFDTLAMSCSASFATRSAPGGDIQIWNALWLFCGVCVSLCNGLPYLWHVLGAKCGPFERDRRQKIWFASFLCIRFALLCAFALCIGKIESKNESNQWVCDNESEWTKVLFGGQCVCWIDSRRSTTCHSSRYQCRRVCTVQPLHRFRLDKGNG